MAHIFKRSKKRSAPWQIQYFDHSGKRRSVSAKTSDHATAERIAAKLESDAALRRENVIDARTDRYREQQARPLSEHLDEFRADLDAKGSSPSHVRQTRNYAGFVLKLASVRTIAGIAPAAVQAAIGMVRDGGASLRKCDVKLQASLRTCNAHLRAAKQFTRWLVRDGRIPSDPLVHLKGFNADTDRRRERRDLSPDELAALIEAAEHGSVVLGITGPDRAIAYRLAAGTGFRVGELRSLTPGAFNLDADPPTVTVEAGYSKRRRADEQPIREDLADVLRPWLATKAPGRPVLRLPDKTAKMMRVDLAAAEIPHTDDAGRVCDFHALRHTYISRVVESGASVKVCQELARHSTPLLTIGRYSHTRLHDLTSALEGLPKTDRPDRESEAARATGTDDIRSPERAAEVRADMRAVKVRNSARGCEAVREQGGRGKSPDASQVLSFARDSDSVRDNATGCGNARPGTRTPNPLIKSQLLCQLS